MTQTVQTAEEIMRGYAEAGARVRLTQLQQEFGLILKMFPNLATQQNPPIGQNLGLTATGEPVLLPNGQARATRTRTAWAAQPNRTADRQANGQPRRKMTTAGRKRISLAQKRRWAAQKAAQTQATTV